MYKNRCAGLGLQLDLKTKKENEVYFRLFLLPELISLWHSSLTLMTRGMSISSCECIHCRWTDKSV
jgi:hypothetical protein